MQKGSDDTVDKEGVVKVKKFGEIIHILHIVL